MIIRIVDKNRNELAGAQIYENNFDGELTIQDVFHCIAENNTYDTIFGTNEEQVTIMLDIVDEESEKEKIASKLENDIQSRFNNNPFYCNGVNSTLNWNGNDIVEDCLIISLTDDGETEDDFFKKMENIYSFIKTQKSLSGNNFTVTLTKYPKWKLQNYHEALFRINLYGGEL